MFRSFLLIQRWRRRFIAMGLAMVVVFASLTVRLWDLQVVNGGHYRTLAEQNRVLRLPVEAERGGITDRNGYVLARNIPGFAGLDGSNPPLSSRESCELSHLSPFSRCSSIRSTEGA